MYFCLQGGKKIPDVKYDLQESLTKHGVLFVTYSLLIGSSGKGRGAGNGRGRGRGGRGGRGGGHGRGGGRGAALVDEWGVPLDAGLGEDGARDEDSKALATMADAADEVADTDKEPLLAGSRLRQVVEWLRGTTRRSADRLRRMPQGQEPDTHEWYDKAPFCPYRLRMSELPWWRVLDHFTCSCLQRVACRAFGEIGSKAALPGCY